LPAAPTGPDQTNETAVTDLGALLPQMKTNAEGLVTGILDSDASGADPAPFTPFLRAAAIWRQIVEPAGF